MNESALRKLRKQELLAMAETAGLRGRSRMTKEELVQALAAPAPPPVPEASGEPKPGERRAALAARLAEFVDWTQHCPWTSIEGYPCGLPVVRGARSCALHGGADVADLGIPITGKLGFDAWPVALRHLWLASYDVDPIGLDPVIAEMVWHIANMLYFDYFRVEVEGIEHVPMDGPGVLVANHGGAALPYDSAMLMLAVLNEAPRPRRVRVTATEIFNILPWVSHLFRKVGAAYASREDAAHILEAGHLLGVFPEGEKGFMKPVWQSYRVQRFGRGGFVDVAEHVGAPIVPVAILGAEEVHPAVVVSKTLARLARLVWPQQRVDGIAVFLNLIPLPVRWRIRFLPPVYPEGGDPDPLRMLERTEAIRGTIQDNLDEMLASRGRVF